MQAGYVLERNEIPIAYRLGAQSGRYFSCMESRYDRRNYEKLSPGIVCLYKHLEELFQENTPEILDFGLGDYGGYRTKKVLQKWGLSDRIRKMLKNKK